MLTLGFTLTGIAGYGTLYAGVKSLTKREQITEKGRKSTLVLGGATTASMVIQSVAQEAVLNKARLYAESFTPEQVQEGLQQLAALEEKLTFQNNSLSQSAKLSNPAPKVLKKEYHTPTITYHKL